MTFFDFIIFFLVCHIRAYPLVSEIIWSLSVYAGSPYCEDEPCYDILFISIMFLLDSILGHTR